jgi:hypothetical protein
MRGQRSLFNALLTNHFGCGYATLVISVAFCAKICLRELWWSEVPHLGAGFAGYSVIRVACSEELSTRFLPMAEMLR